MHGNWCRRYTGGRGGAVRYGTSTSTASAVAETEQTTPAVVVSNDRANATMTRLSHPASRLHRPNHQQPDQRSVPVPGDAEETLRG